MIPFTLVTTLLSMLILGVFIILGVRKFGTKFSYSTYAPLWGEEYPIHNVNLWSAMTTVAALLLVPGLIERASNSPIQFFGFLAPLYLVVVAMTPEYRTKKIQGIVHVAASLVCAVAFLAYCIFGLHMWYVPAIFVSLFALVALATNTEKTSWVLWLECALFSSAYATIYLGGLV